MSDMMTDICMKCGVSFRRALLLAMMKDAGAQTRDSSECPGNGGGDHDFQPASQVCSK